MAQANRTISWHFQQATLLGNVSEVQGNRYYTNAKSGDIVASLNLVNNFIHADFITELTARYNDINPILAAVHGVESISVNQIPLAMAVSIAVKTGWQFDTDIIQINKAGHTKASGWHRLAHQALFVGNIQKGRHYIVTDDFIGQGGTIANIKGYIEINGGIVMDTIILAGKDYSAKLALSTTTLQELRSKHGKLEFWWQQRFGFDFDALTESEARYLIRAEDADTIRNRLAHAKQSGGG